MTSNVFGKNKHFRVTRDTTVWVLIRRTFNF